jgi:hypothetical protein
MSGTTGTTTLIWNERTKLLANALDRASTAVGTGGIFPLINAWRAGQASQLDGLAFFASAYIFFCVAVLLH